MTTFVGACADDGAAVSEDTSSSTGAESSTDPSTTNGESSTNASTETGTTTSAEESTSSAGESSSSAGESSSSAGESSSSAGESSSSAGESSDTGVPACDCDADEFCDYPDDACGSGSAGVCAARPEGCPDNIDPVCGCDGVTYNNECDAQAAGVDADFPGECGVVPACDCGAGQYCELPEGVCKGDDGTCVDMPDACGEIYAPVCGCDGITYGNPCEAAGAGMNVAYDGEC